MSDQQVRYPLPIPTTTPQGLTTKRKKSNADKIAKAQANLPLPDDPPVASDWNSSDARTVNVGAGDSKRADNPQLSASSDGLREPASGDSAVRVDGETYGTQTAGLNVGRTAVEGLDKPPSDAVKGNHGQGVSGTTKADYGYPASNDPSSGVDGPTRAG